MKITEYTTVPYAGHKRAARVIEAQVNKGIGSVVDAPVVLAPALVEIIATETAAPAMYEALQMIEEDEQDLINGRMPRHGFRVVTAARNRALAAARKDSHA